MSFIHNSALAGASGQGGVYEIEQSLRFDDNGSTYLNRTPSSAGNQKTWTFSAWLKRGSFTANQGIFNPVYGGDGSNESQIRWKSDNTLQIYDSGGARLNFVTTQVFRDPSAWYHLVIAVDTTQATEANRFKLYINGEQITAFGTSTYPTQNQTLGWNGTSRHDIGRYAQGGNLYYGGYMAEIHHVDGTQLDPTSFGEYDDNGVWRPINVSGLTYGTNGFYINFSNSSNLGEDQAGSNDFTASGFTTSGTGTDVMSDTPTTNWCTLNPLDKGEFGAGITLSEGNLRAVSTSSDRHVRSTFFLPTSGKWYWEMTATTVNTAGYLATGLYHSTGSLTATAIATAQGRWYAADGYGNGSSWGATYDDGDIIGIAVDMDSGKIWAAKNNTWQASGDPAAGTNPMYDDLLTAYSADGWSPVCANWQSGNTADFNFGQRAFAYTPPTGFKALNTKNLPAPDIAEGSEYFQTVLWTGDDTDDRSITVADNSGNSWQPDWVWYKRRNATASHLLFDAVRGATKALSSNNTNAENTEPNALQAFESTGFQVGSDANSNSSSYNYVAWNWLAANGTTTNTDGNITGTVTVSANPTAGFSIVSYTGTGSLATVGHGLGVAPDMVITKPRDGGDHYWGVYHRYGSQGAETQLQLQTTTAPNTGTSFWNGTHPTSTVFTVNTASGTNNSGSNIIAYCFTSVEGYSKFGSYTGSGGQQFVYLGFTPEFVMLKRSDSSSDTNSWFMFDATRDPINNNAAEPLMANKTFAEGTLPDGGSGSSGNVDFDFYSNGFGFPSYQGVGFNGSGATIIYAAFAKNPFGGFGVSPATAR